jgi:hypothetical protein
MELGTYTTTTKGMIERHITKARQEACKPHENGGSVITRAM